MPQLTGLSDLLKSQAKVHPAIHPINMSESSGEAGTGTPCQFSSKYLLLINSIRKR